MQKNTFNHIALGGTFDRLHKGHRHFLNHAFKISEQITIGITSNQFAKEIHQNNKLQSFNQRKKSVANYAEKQKANKKITIIKLNDLYGNTIDEHSIEAILVTNDTVSGGKKIQKERKRQKKTSLQIIIFPLVLAEDGINIASTRIRKGEIDREGVHYPSRLFKTVPLKLPKQLRQEFRKPFGKIFKTNETDIYNAMKKVEKFISQKNLSPIICVGDVVTHSILSIGESPEIMIVDLRVQRKRRFKEIGEIGEIDRLKKFEIKNQSGMITFELSKKIHELIKNNQVGIIEVKGEEDLAVLPSVILAPLGAIVLYGHFQYGIIAVIVTEEKKAQALTLLNSLKK